MAFKIDVVDRKSTYPGRVTLVPVNGEPNTYDMTRADVPIQIGTPIDKILFDSKSDILTEDMIDYVATTGNDTSGDGTSAKPLKTIQKAIDLLPKDLGGHTVTIDIVDGTYTERVSIRGFSSGQLILGRSSRRATIVGGIDVVNSSLVETNIYKMTKATGGTQPLLHVTNGSHVLIGNNMTLDGLDTSIVGISADKASFVVVKDSTLITINNCASTIQAYWCSFVTMSAITGSGNIFGMAASQGGIISYFTDTTEKAWSNLADSGGLVLTGDNSSDLSDATLAL